MTAIDYIGFDIHKKTISFCAKALDGTILDEGTIPALRTKLLAWAQARPRPWIGAMEATLFTGWIYDLLKPLALEALRQNATPMPGNPVIAQFAAQVDDELQKLGARLRSGTAAAGNAGLRDLQTALQRALESAGDEQRVHAIAWIEASDRITDSVNTIAHLLEKGSAPARIAHAQDRHARAHPARRMAESRRKIRRRPFPGDGAHRGPPSHLQGR